MFNDRTEAGRRLAEELRSRGVAVDIVLTIPRGGVPVAEPIAERLDVPLDVVVAKKITLPSNPEYAVGAVTPDGAAWYDSDTLERLELTESDLREEEARARERAAEKRDAFLDGREPAVLEGLHVLLVDDGVATGATMQACIRTADEAGASRITVAVPVASQRSVHKLDADEVIVLQVPEQFRAVGQFFDSFDQVSTEEAVRYLEQSPAPG